MNCREHRVSSWLSTDASLYICIHFRVECGLRPYRYFKYATSGLLVTQGQMHIEQRQNRVLLEDYTYTMWWNKLVKNYVVYVYYY